MKSADSKNDQFDFYTQNPRTGQKIKGYHYCSESIATQEIETLYRSFHVWKNLELTKRMEVLNFISERIEFFKDEISQCLHQEMGKPLQEAQSEVLKSAKTIKILSQLAPDVLAKKDLIHDKIKTLGLSGPYKNQSVVYNPLGVILGIMPWNFPLWQFIRFSVPTLLSGNTIILKPADLTAGIGIWMEKIFSESEKKFNLPPIFKNLHMDHVTAEKIIVHPYLQGVSFTGSTQGGKKVAEICARNLKKSVLELGGSDAYIILEDADLDLALEACWKGRFINGGQSCIAAKRWIVVDKVYSEFKSRLLGKLKKIESEKLNTYYLSHKKFQIHLRDQVESLMKKGVTPLVCDVSAIQRFISGPTSEFPICILEFLSSQNCFLQSEELFGPVISLIHAQDEKQAIQLANASDFGLGGAVFSQNLHKAPNIAQNEIQSGLVVVNDFVRSDALIPFGGIKSSGWGRELGELGFYEFVNIKSTAVYL